MSRADSLAELRGIMDSIATGVEGQDERIRAVEKDIVALFDRQRRSLSLTGFSGKISANPWRPSADTEEAARRGQWFLDAARMLPRKGPT